MSALAGLVLGLWVAGLIGAVLLGRHASQIEDLNERLATLEDAINSKSRVTDSADLTQAEIKKFADWMTQSQDAPRLESVSNIQDLPPGPHQEGTTCALFCGDGYMWVNGKWLQYAINLIPSSTETITAASESVVIKV